MCMCHERTSWKCELACRMIIKGFVKTVHVSCCKQDESIFNYIKFRIGWIKMNVLNIFQIQIFS